MPKETRAKQCLLGHRRNLLMLCLLPTVGCALSSNDKQSWVSRLDPRTGPSPSETTSDTTKSQLAVFKNRSKSDLLTYNAAAQAQLRQVNAEIQQETTPLPKLQDTEDLSLIHI